MTGAPLGRAYAGARIRLAEGQARLLPPGVVPRGMVAGRFSVLSPGTEQRHLAGPAREAGYMTLGRASDAGGWTLAPVPHGAAFDPACDGALVAPHGVSVQVAALARFQQMALLGLNRVPGGILPARAVVVGSGPVALGCVLELARRGATHIQVVTSRRYAAMVKAPGVRCVTEAEAQKAELVIDAAGHPEAAAALVAPAGVLGLLGTPAASMAVPALAVHRGGWTVVGMHELAPVAPDSYQGAYAVAATWLAENCAPDLIAGWCRTVPGALAPRVYRTLGLPRRPVEPVILFVWEAAS